MTLMELMIFLVLAGTGVSMTLPVANDAIRQRRLVAATQALVADLDVARSLSARQRKPVRLAYDASSGEVRITDRSSGAVYHRRPLRTTSEYRLDAVSMTPASVEFFPTGVGSSAFTISLTNGTFSRDVVVTRTGLARVVVP